MKLHVPILVASLALSASGSAQTAPAGSVPTAKSDVVVTGRRLDETEAALKACVARHCPPNEDADATLAHAENLFVAGRYKDARGVVQSALGRTKRFAKTYPVAVADLWRTESRLAVHLGEADAYRIGAIESLDALRAGLPADDPRVLEQQLEVADTFAHLGRIEGAVQMYDALAHRAETLHRPKTGAYVQLHKAMLYTALSATAPEYRSAARREIALLAQGGDPSLQPFRDAAGMLSAQLAIRSGDKDGVAKLIAAARVTPTARPVLLYAPPIEQTSNLRAFESGDVNQKMPVGDYDDQWADVSFWIRPDGTVADTDLLRGSPTLDRNWLKPVFAAIGGRRYAPLKLASDDPGVLRVERYTRTSHLTTLAGSHLRVHEAYPRIEMLDLSDDPQAAATPAG